MVLSGCAITHTGRVRKHNEDNFRLFDSYHKNIIINRQRFCAKSKTRQAIAAVADGVGGEEAGELAALTTVKLLAPMDINKELIIKSIQKVNESVCRLSGNTATTLAALYFDNGRAISCNLGDSRIYLYRNAELKLLTHDHTEGQRMIDMNIMEEREARKDSRWHRLTQYLGVSPEDFVLEPFFGPMIELKKGDLFVLASDGLTDMVMDEEMRLIIKDMTWSNGRGYSGIFKRNIAKMIAEKLLTQALARGGKDNTTIIVIEVGKI